MSGFELAKTWVTSACLHNIQMTGTHYNNKSKVIAVITAKHVVYIVICAFVH